MWRSALRNAARKPVGGDAVEPSAGRASSDVPTAPSSSRVVRDTRRDASDALEMHVSVYNLPSALTRRTHPSHPVRGALGRAMVVVVVSRAYLSRRPRRGLRQTNSSSALAVV